MSTDARAGSAAGRSRRPRRATCRRPGAVDAHCHVFGPQAAISVQPEGQISPAGRRAGDAVRAARPSRLCPQRHRPGELPRHRQSRDAGRASPNRTARRAAWRWSIRRSPTPISTALHDGGIRGVRFNFLKRLVDDAPEGQVPGVSHAHRAARLARRRLFRGGHPGGVAALPRRDPGADRDRPYGPPRRRAGARRRRHARFRALLDSRARHLDQGRPAPTGSIAAGRPYDDFVAAVRPLVEDYPDRVLWGTDWPHPNMENSIPDDGALVDVIPRIARYRRTAAQASRRQSDAALLGEISSRQHVRARCRRMTSKQVLGPLERRIRALFYHI